MKGKGNFQVSFLCHQKNEKGKMTAEFRNAGNKVNFGKSIISS